MDGAWKVAAMCMAAAVVFLPQIRPRAADLDGPPVVEATAAPAERLPEPEVPLLDERTAYTLRRHTLKLGLLTFDYAITDRLSVGTDPPAWALRSFTSILVPNLHVKMQFIDLGPVAVAGRAAAYFAYLNSSDTSGQLLDIPLSVFASVRVLPDLFLHVEGTYVYAHLIGAGDLSSGEVNGAAANNSIQTALMVEYRLTRIFSITAMGRVQPYESNVTFDVTQTADASTTFQLNGEVVPRVQHPWQAVAGIALLWSRVHLIAGVGYGNYFAPGLDIAVPKRTVVPDLSLSVLL
jgi:hypothetical protein